MFGFDAAEACGVTQTILSSKTARILIKLISENEIAR